MATPSASPQDVGVHAVEVYFPKTYVTQEDLEKYDNVPAGKYTVGLGQTNMAYCGDREDINSICMTAVKNLLEKYNIKPTEIGRLEVGTETIIDKSKAVKTTLMSLFEESGNTSIEGVDTMNACYGGTNALFNAIQWVESSYWDGRYAIVVAGDIAVYEKGPARPTGGAGCVAMLVGPNAPIVFDRGLRGTYMEHAYDFYKPNLHSEYPLVDGKLSVECYLRAVDNCYARYGEKFTKQSGSPFNVNVADYVIFHAPYNKLVQKSFGRMVYNDMIADAQNPTYAPIAQYASLGLGPKSYGSAVMEKALAEFSKKMYQEKVGPGTILPKSLGNSYTGALTAGFASLLHEVGNGLVGKRVMFLSYGSGLAASLFSATVRRSVGHIQKNLDLKNRLSLRTQSPPAKFEEALTLREKRHGQADYTPTDPIDHLFPGTYYLSRVDSRFRRFYERTPLARANL